MDTINRRIAGELGAKPEQVAAAVALLAEGATVPFIARYRKEKTGGLDDTQLRRLEERLAYLTELEARRRSAVSLPCSSMLLSTASRRSSSSRRYARRCSSSRNWMSSRPPVASLR